MRYQFIGTVKVQVKSYFVTHDVRTRATKMHLAMKQAVEQVLKVNYKGRRITDVIVHLQKLGPVADFASGCPINDDERADG